MTDFKAVTVNLGNQEIEIVQEFAAMIYEGKFSPALTNTRRSVRVLVRPRKSKMAAAAVHTTTSFLLMHSATPYSNPCSGGSPGQHTRPF